MSTPPRVLGPIIAKPPHRPRRPRPLWHRLLWLAIAVMVPLALLAAAGAALMLLQQRHQAQRAALDFTRAFANAVQAELGRSVAVLDVLAATLPLDETDARERRQLLLRALKTQPDWLALLLIDASGRIVADTGEADPSRPAAIAERASFERALRERRPVVGSLARGRSGRWGVPVRYPIVRDGEVRLVLTGVLSPDAILKIVQRQRVPEDWVISVFDSHEKRVARSRAHARELGTGPAPSLRALMASPRPEGAGITSALEGDAIYSAYVRLPDTGWTVAVGLPAGTVRTDIITAAALYGVALVLSLVVALVLALRFAGRINRPIAELREGARALGRGDLPDVARTGIVEVDDVADALADAARDRARGEAERDALLGAERDARTVAEAARHRLELLAAAGARLAHSLETQATLQAVAQSVVPSLVDWCNIDLVDDEGRLQRALVYHADEAQRHRVRELLLHVRPKPDVEGSMAWTARTGRSHFARFPSEAAREAIADEDFRAIAQAMQMRVHFILPLVARGRTLGAMAVAQAESGRDLDADDQSLLGTLAQRAALAIDNARLYTQAEAARAQAEAASRAKDEFLAMLGHELRNPLAPIVTALELMKRRHPDTAGQERAIIERQVRHLARLVDDLLDVARIAQGKVQLDRQRTDLRLVVDKALELTSPALAGRPPVELRLPPGPVWVDGDELRLVQVVCNLLANAVKFTPSEGAIRLELAGEGDDAVLAVSDEGSGIVPALLPHVFDLFVQGERSLDRRGGGLGLGLGIVRMLVEMHAGTVSADSAGAGRGSRFVVRLPRAAGPPAPPEPAPTPAALLHGGRVLLVDDNRDAAESLGALVADAGYEVRIAHDGPAALEAVAAGFAPDLALLDIGLPGMTGYELAAALRTRLPELTLIAITGYGREPDRARALAAAFDEHLVKPVRIDALLAAMARLRPRR